MVVEMWGKKKDSFGERLLSRHMGKERVSGSLNGTLPWRTITDDWEYSISLSWKPKGENFRPANGDSISLWRDMWLVNSNLCMQFPLLSFFVFLINKMCGSPNAWGGNRIVWKVTFGRSLNEWGVDMYRNLLVGICGGCELLGVG